MHRYGLLALVELSLLHSVLSQINPGFPYGSEKVRGVNLGGWLVLEVSAVSRTVKIPHRSLCLDVAMDHPQHFRQHRKCEYCRRMDLWTIL